MKLNSFCLIILALFTHKAFTHTLQPGFDKQEYLQTIYMSARIIDSENYYKDIPEPNYTRLYHSPVMGLDNMWDLWEDTRNVSVISIRGTTEKPESWLANFYAAMVPAKGKIKINETETFNYHLAENSKAAIHVGWLLSTAFLSKDMIPKIKQQYEKGCRNIIITGHSQGGAIAYLITAHFYHLQKTGQLPADIRFKTYCSAGPKPGNLYFAYDYEALTQNGWAYNVVNAADWVPEVPMSIQTLNDFNVVNPFANAKMIIKKQKFPARMVMKSIYRKLDKPTRKAQKNYQKYLGNMASKIVKQNLKGAEKPEFYKSNHYVRTGNIIVLTPDEDYYKVFPNDQEKFFGHHFHQPYLYLTNKLNY